MSKITKTIDGKTYELTNSGEGCTTCHLVTLFPIPKNGEVAECVKQTNSACLSIVGSNFKIKK